MDLDEGSKKKDVFCEVEGGGLVAYLIRSDDLEIRNPLARIHIRRFDNRKGESVALPEESVYGNEVEGFYDAVASWLDKMQPNINPGRYDLKGGSYSDSFSKSKMVEPKNKEDIIAWFRGEAKDAVFSDWRVEDNLYEIAEEVFMDYRTDYESHPMNYIENLSKTFNTKEEAEKYIEEHTDEERDKEIIEMLKNFEESQLVVPKSSPTYLITDQRLHIQEIPNDIRRDMKDKAANIILESKKGTYPQEILEEVKNYALKTSRNYRSKILSLLIKKYPELLTPEELSEMRDEDNLEVLKNLPPEKRKQFIGEWQENVSYVLENAKGTIINDETQNRIEEFDLASSVQEKVSAATSVTMSVLMNFHDYVEKPINYVFDQIPENIIRQLINFANSIENYLPEKIIENLGETNELNRIKTAIAQMFSLKNADTPVVQGYYEGLLKQWGGNLSNYYADQNYEKFSDINIDSLGYSIAKLGENGKQFIPFFEERLKIEKQKEEKCKKEVEENPNESILMSLNFS
jgi:hypothetical protein